jgi:hypothetical protein
MDSHKKNPQNAQFALLTEFCKNLESNHEFYVKQFKRFKNDLDHKNRIISQSAQEWIKREIEMMRAWYEVTENPVFLWKALAFCIEGELDFPEWITKYMHNSADKIMKAAHNYQTIGFKNFAPNFFKHCLSNFNDHFIIIDKQNGSIIKWRIISFGFKFRFILATDDFI